MTTLQVASQHGVCGWHVWAHMLRWEREGAAVAVREEEEGGDRLGWADAREGREEVSRKEREEGERPKEEKEWAVGHGRSAQREREVGQEGKDFLFFDFLLLGFYKRIALRWPETTNHLQ